MLAIYSAAVFKIRLCSISDPGGGRGRARREGRREGAEVSASVNWFRAATPPPSPQVASAPGHMISGSSSGG